MKIYILKTEGIGKMADHVQIRDEKLRLIAFFNINHPEKSLESCGLSAWHQKITEAAAMVPYGKIEGLTLE
jgi:hypothetical protein